MPSLRIVVNREEVLTINLHRKGNQYRAVGPNSTTSGSNRLDVIFDSLATELLSRPRFRAAVIDRLRT